MKPKVMSSLLETQWNLWHINKQSVEYVTELQNSLFFPPLCSVHSYLKERRRLILLLLHSSSYYYYILYIHTYYISYTTLKW